MTLNFKRLGARRDEWNGETNPERLYALNTIPYENIFADYSANPNDASYEIMKPFSEIENMKLASLILEDFDECYYDYDSFVTMFVLHDTKKSEDLTAVIRNPWTASMNDIRDYYGKWDSFVYLIIELINNRICFQASKLLFTLPSVFTTPRGWLLLSFFLSPSRRMCMKQVKQLVLSFQSIRLSSFFGPL